MNAEHKEILRRHRPDLVREMGMDGLLTELLASKVISDLMSKRIQVSVSYLGKKAPGKKVIVTTTISTFSS